MTDASTLFEVLSARQRRRILFALCDADAVSLSTVNRTRSGSAVEGATERASADTGPTPTENPEEEKLLLIHSHLPKLEDAGLVEWDRDSRTVSRGPEFEEVEPALRLLAANLNRFPDDVV